MKEITRNNPPKASAAFKVGAISLAFLIVGYQVALFVHRVSVERIVANHDIPDTVFVIDRALAEEILKSGPAVEVGDKRKEQEQIIVRKPGNHSQEAKATAQRGIKRPVESFSFDPNTASMEVLMRLGFSEKQAMSIDNYRAKGGKFRRKSDFAKSYVVCDSVFRRLEPYIEIPKIDINKADSALFDSLPGIGGWFAGQMVDYRKRLRGYSRIEQLMEIYHFDQEKFDCLKDLITCSAAEPYPLWTAPADSIRLHPHIRSWQTARAIVLYRDNNPRDKWTVDGLLSAGILSQGQAARLNLCNLK